MLALKPLSQLEAQVCAITRDYLKKFKEIDLETLVPYLHNTLGNSHPHPKITEAVIKLVQNRYFINGSSLTRDDVLSNQIRKQILHFIQINPGCYNRFIRRELNIGSNEFNWHIGMLERFGLIKKIQYDRSYGYFENRSYMGHEFDLFLLQNEKAATILKYLESHPKVTLSQLAKDLMMHYSTVQKHVDILTERYLILQYRSGKHILLSVNTELINKLRKIINGAVFVEFAD
jgi:predicted transcriptional regulator